MGCVQRLLTSIIWINFALAEVNIADVTILNYDGLKTYYFRSKAQLKQFYYFQFCLCPNDANLLSQSPFHKCECTSLTRGKCVADSSPHAVFSSSCISETASTNCLKATFPRNLHSMKGQRLLVRATIEQTTVSQPEWQQLPLHSLKNTYFIRTAAGPSISITYFSTFKTPSKSKDKGFHSVNAESKKENLAIFDFIHFDKSARTSKKGFQKNYGTFSPGESKETSKSTKNKTVDQEDRFLLQESLRDYDDSKSFNVKLFRDELTIYHNIYRARHDAPPLVYDRKLEKAAQRWADFLGSEKRCLVHEQPRKYGENLFYFGAIHFPSAVTMARMVTQSFYMEGSGYDYKKFYSKSYYKTGHFTQLIWKGTRRLGIGVFVSHSSALERGPCSPSMPLYMIYVVVKYDPAGNLQTYGSYMENVLPPRFQS